MPGYTGGGGGSGGGQGANMNCVGSTSCSNGDGALCERGCVYTRIIMCVCMGNTHMHVLRMRCAVIARPGIVHSHVAQSVS